MKQYGKIMWINLRHHLWQSFAAAVVLALLTLFLFNVTALQAGEAAKPLEFLLCWTGVALLTPTFRPEQSEGIRDVIRVRKTDYLVVCGLRVLYSVIVLALLIAGFCGIMKQCESEVPAYHVFAGIATALFLGAVSFAAAGISDNAAVGYMTAMLYYLLNYGAKDKLGKLYLFSMSAGKYQDKGWLFGAALILIGITFMFLFLKQKRKY